MLIPIGEGRWRTLRRLFLAGGEADWAAVRQWNRRGQAGGEDQEWLARHGLIAVEPGTEGGRVRLTERGRQAQELGEVDVPLEALTGGASCTTG